jgi:peroxiredoxin/outer membrane protein assembly factor BamD (BamD/ComL family)
MLKLTLQDSYMRCATIILGFILAAPTIAQENVDGPASEKARKTWNEALEYLHKHNHFAALDSFKKADKQDGGHCVPCQKQVVNLGLEFGDWKAAENAASEMVAESKSERETALAHYQLGSVLYAQGLQKHKAEIFSRAHDEFAQALATHLSFPDALLQDGKTLSQLHQDKAAVGRFQQYVKLIPNDGPRHQRALRLIAHPELARARLAPPFSIKTVDGQQISMDDLQGKVVLLDFWATWCAPCREALPHIRDVARKFQGQPIVILSVSVDHDIQKWQDFIAKNDMTWPQYFDNGFEGPIAKMFDVHAIPHTFTIDADGVLQDEHIGDASIEGKLKKLVARARELPQTAAN